MAALVALAVVRHRARLDVHSYLAPVSGNYVSERGLLDGLEMVGVRPTVLPIGVRFAATIVVVSVILCFAILMVWLRTERRPDARENDVSWRTTLLLLGPLAVAYFLLLCPRALFRGLMYDRYLLPLIVLLLPLLLRLYQERIAERLPVLSLLATLLFAGFGVAGMHDLFALYRARLEAINEIRSEGVGRTSIRGGWGYDGWTQLEVTGYVNEPNLTVPAGAYHIPPSDADGSACQNAFHRFTPSIKARFMLSFDPSACLGLAPFAPVRFRTWFAPHQQTVYVVKLR